MRILYYAITGLLTVALLGSTIGGYFMNTPMIREVFESLGYPSYLVIPLGIAKMLGLVAIWFSPYRSLKEWAYAGFFFDFVLALLAHYQAGNGRDFIAISSIVMLLVSYFAWKSLATESSPLTFLNRPAVDHG